MEQRLLNNVRQCNWYTKSELLNERLRPAEYNSFPDPEEIYLRMYIYIPALTLALGHGLSESNKNNETACKLRGSDHWLILY